MNLIKRCPCGQTPSEIHITDTGDRRPKWAHCHPDCCGEWEIEYRNGYVDIHSDIGKDQAVKAWNAAARADCLMEDEDD